VPEKSLEQQSATAWKIQKRAGLLSRRFDFDDYDSMRDFLDRLEVLSEKEAYYPDLTFSRTHVNVSIKSRDDELAQLDFDFSIQVDALLDGLADATD
jgi:pterin-4a-carbinolamine dehydratase